jgi:aminoglycoside phosphotransferase (APT) family kinase protein
VSREPTRVLDGVRQAPEILRALAALGAQPIAAAPIGGWRAGRTTYRFTLSDGRVVKARQLRSRARTARAAALTTAIGDPRLPAPLAVMGSVTIDAWVDGTPLTGQALTDANVDAAADLLGCLHAMERVPGHRFHRQRRSTAVAARFERRLHDLIAAGVVDRGEQQRLASAVRDGLPERAARGVIHGDLRPENLVVTAGGDLVSVDNEAVSIDFLDYDLGRSWCRWPMPDSAWSRFLRRYGRWGRSAADPVAELAWRSVAAVKGAHRWHRAVRANTDAPLVALRRLVHHLP